MKTATTLLLIASEFALSYAQTPISFSDLIPFTNSFISNRTFPGAQIAVISSGYKTHFETVIGNLTYPGDRYNDPVTEDVIYDIASLSKVVGATSCAMKLYDMGLLNLDDQWVKYVPEGNNNGKDKITIRNLLLHNAGFAPDYPFYGYYTNVT
jgi:serine-type D-Ala-D-Ala carboxypeptidase